jgi:hypothetical protein
MHIARFCELLTSGSPDAQDQALAYGRQHFTRPPPSHQPAPSATAPPKAASTTSAAPITSTSSQGLGEPSSEGAKDSSGVDGGQKGAGGSKRVAAKLSEEEAELLGDALSLLAYVQPETAPAGYLLSQVSGRA